MATLGEAVRSARPVQASSFLSRYSMPRSLAFLTSFLKLLVIPAAAQMPADLPLADDLRDRMVGRYDISRDEGDGPTMSLRLYVDDGRLMGQIDGNDPTPMLYQGDLGFRPQAMPVALLTVAEMGETAMALTIETPDGSMSGVRAGSARPDPSISGPLFEELRAMDQQLFRTIFVDCDAEAAVALLDEDAEFYHDKGGRSIDGDVHAAIRNQATSCPREQGVTREVDEASLFVSPIAGFGAVQTGTHRFVEAGGVTVARFLHVWRASPDGWRIHRAISYDHRPESH